MQDSASSAGHVACKKADEIVEVFFMCFACADDSIARQTPSFTYVFGSVFVRKTPTDSF